ncbi:MAG: hypothetical protein OXD44_04605 [Gammaproteobacteria bacterium]|nr:hypothetical protein [Gammaproteobacteria bacterium]
MPQSLRKTGNSSNFLTVIRQIWRHTSSAGEFHVYRKLFSHDHQSAIAFVADTLILTTRVTTATERNI